MKVLLVGVGGVGEAIAILAQGRPWLEKMVLADYNLKRARDVRRRLRQRAPFRSSRSMRATSAKLWRWRANTR